MKIRIKHFILGALIALVVLLITQIKLFTLNSPIDLSSAIVGGIIGLFLVRIWEILSSPRILWFNYSFVRDKVNFGTLYKLKFKLSGLRNPGFCELQIYWCGYMVRAKWDELPLPLRDKKFEAELVPQGFFLPLMIGQDYYIPILHEDEKGNLTIFSGWWFGRDKGYGSDPSVNKKTQIKLILRGNELSWEKDFIIESIVSTTVNV